MSSVLGTNPVDMPLLSDRCGSHLLRTGGRSEQRGGHACIVLSIHFNGSSKYRQAQLLSCTQNSNRNEQRERHMCGTDKDGGKGTPFLLYSKMEYAPEYRLRLCLVNIK